MAIEIDEDSHIDIAALADPSSDHWWRYFNDEVRKKHSRRRYCGLQSLIFYVYHDAKWTSKGNQNSYYKRYAESFSSDSQLEELDVNLDVRLGDTTCSLD